LNVAAVFFVQAKTEKKAEQQETNHAATGSLRGQL